MVLTNPQTYTYTSVSTNTSARETFQSPFSEKDIIISASIIIPLSIFGLFANSVTILVIFTSLRLKNIFNYLLVSLCVSDFLSALISPLLLYRRTWGFDNWELSSALCKIYWGIDTLTSVVTAIHILTFAALRFASLRFPTFYYKISTTKTAMIIAATWFVSLCAGFIPSVILYNSRVHDRTSTDVTAKWPSCTIEKVAEFRVYAIVAYTMFFFFPLTVIASLSIATIYVIIQKRNERSSMITRNQGSKKLEDKRQRKEHQIMLQLLLIVGSFGFGYIPHTAYQIFTTTFQPISDDDFRLDWRLGVAEHICLRISECLNPIFYNLASSKMRNETLVFLSRFCNSGKCKKYTSSSEASTGVPLETAVQTIESKNVCSIENVDL